MFVLLSSDLPHFSLVISVFWAWADRRPGEGNFSYRAQQGRPRTPRDPQESPFWSVLLTGIPQGPPRTLQGSPGEPFWSVLLTGNPQGPPRTPRDPLGIPFLLIASYLSSTLFHRDLNIHQELSYSISLTMGWWDLAERKVECLF